MRHLLAAFNCCLRQRKAVMTRACHRARTGLTKSQLLHTRGEPSLEGLTVCGASSTATRLFGAVTHVLDLITSLCRSESGALSSGGRDDWLLSCSLNDKNRSVLNQVCVQT